MTDWRCREVRADELGGVRSLVSSAPLSQTFHLTDRLAEPAAPGRWWYAAIGPGGVGAFAAIEGTTAHLFGDDTSAVEAMARSMLQGQKMHTSREAHRHVLFGPASVIDPFWAIFQDVGRQVVANRSMALMAGDTEGKGSRRMELALAKAADLGLCVQFLGEHHTERHGTDPRKTAPAAFERDVATAVEQQRVLVGRETGRAMFVAEAAPLSEAVVMLRRVHVPLPYRSRKLLVGGALFEARSLGPGAAKTVWVLADELTQVAAERAGYSVKGMWREVAMIG